MIQKGMLKCDPYSLDFQKDKITKDTPNPDSVSEEDFEQAFNDKIKIYPDYDLIIETDMINLYVTLESNIKIVKEIFPIYQKNILNLIDLHNIHEYIPALEKRLERVVLDKYREIKFRGTRFNNTTKRNFGISEQELDNLFESYEQEVEQKLRATGRSTKLLDSYVQELFEKGFVEVIDHHNTTQSNTLLFGKLVQRLTNEHRGLRFDITYPNKIKLK